MKVCINLFVCTLLVLSVSVNAKDIQSGLSVVDTISTEDDVSIDEEVSEEAMEPFIPSHEWQTIREGQVIAAGLHIRLNLQTGLKEAKILDTSEEQTDRSVELIDKHKKVGKTRNTVNSKVDIIKDQMKRLLQDMRSEQKLSEAKDPNHELEQMSTNFRPIHEIKKDLEDMNIKIGSESELLKSLIEKYKKASIEEQLVLLSDIEYLVHSIDIAQDFVKMDGIDLLVPALNSTDSRVRAQIAFTFGSALNANPKVQIEVLRKGVLKELLLLLRYDSSMNVKKRALFAICSLVRQFPIAQKALIQEYGALSLFANLFKDSDINSIKLSAKVMTLLNDLLIEQQMTTKYAINDGLSQTKAKQYEEIGLNEAIISEGFCDLIPNLLNSPDNDVREKTIEAMSSLLVLCKKQFINSLPILHEFSINLKELSKFEVNNDSTDTYFTNLYQLTSNLIYKLNTDLRDEF